MSLERMTALKVKIVDLTSGKWVKKEGFEPSYILTKNNEAVSRARILGTVVGRFVSEDGNFASITIDDSTDTIRAKTFKTIKPLDKVNVGDIVDLIGKVREYNEEIYIIPEIVRVVSDPNFELLRELEILKKTCLNKSSNKPRVENHGNIKEEILKVLESEKEGINYSVLATRVKASESQIEDTISELLAEGICYEPTPGTIKKI